MTKILEKLVVEMSALPDDVQERLGSELLERVSKWRTLKGDIDEGIAAADRGDVRGIEPQAFIKQALARHGGA